MRMTMIVTAFVVITAMENRACVAQASPCSTAEAAQFDFWVGDWNLSWDDGNGGTAKGKNVIAKVLNSCVIEENFHDPNTGFTGRSHSVYHPLTGLWKQTWVDNAGAYLDFVGKFADGRMVLSRSATTAAGGELQQRMVWYNIESQSLDWNWESSTDGGKTWTVNWKIHYEKN